MKKSIILLLITLLSQLIFAQDYKKEFEAFSQKNKDAFGNYSDSIKLSYDAYVRAIDKAFSEALQENWISFKLVDAVKPDNGNKPEEKPAYIPDNTSPRNKEVEIIIDDNLEVKEEKGVPIIPEENPDDLNLPHAKYNFYGYSGQFSFDGKTTDIVSKNYLLNDVSSFWSLITETNITPLLIHLQNTRIKLQLNDWGYFRLVMVISESLCKENSNSKNLMAWYMMLKSGYKVKLYSLGNDLTIGISTNVVLYNKNYITEGSDQYFLINAPDEKYDIYSYKGNYIGAEKSLNMFLTQSMNLPLNREVKVCSVEYIYPERNITELEIAYNKNQVDFYTQYPNCDLSVPLNASSSATLKQSVVEQIGSIIENLTEQERVSFILNFVQKGFDYKTDQEQFGYEKYFFPEELFAYPYSDCEDRTALFIWLVRNFTECNVIGLSYPGHLCAAVQFNQNVIGDYIMYKSGRYTVCDPTYIGAPIGKTMPEFRNTKAEIIEQHTDVGKDFATKANPIENHESDLFKYNALIKEAASQSNCHPIASCKSDNCLIIAGSFTGTITLGSKSISNTTGETHFIAKLGPVNNVIWLKKIESSINEAGYFIAMISSDGIINWNRKYEGIEPSSDYIVSVDNNENFYLTYTNSRVARIENKTITGGREFSVVDFLLEESDKLKSQNYNQSMVGLFAVINLIENGNSVISGLQAQQALDKANPQFRKTSPNIYKNIGRIKFIKNSNGIVVIETSDKESVSFDKLQVSNGARIKITRYNSGATRIDAISGIVVGKAFIWYKLNYIKIFKESDTMIFDYDDDHSQTTVAMKSDILD